MSGKRKFSRHKLARNGAAAALGLALMAMPARATERKWENVTFTAETTVGSRIITLSGTTLTRQNTAYAGTAALIDWDSETKIGTISGVEFGTQTIGSTTTNEGLASIINVGAANSTVTLNDINFNGVSVSSAITSGFYNFIYATGSGSQYTLSSSDFEDNVKIKTVDEKENYGGLVHFLGAASVDVDSVIFRNNTVGASNDNQTQGSAMELSSVADAKISNSTFEGNKNTSFYGAEGTVTSYNSVNITIGNTTFKDNFNASYYLSTGALYVSNRWGNLANPNAYLTVKDSTFEDNTAYAASYYDTGTAAWYTYGAVGGAIDIETGNATTGTQNYVAAIENTVFKGNSVVYESRNDDVSQGYTGGGAIFFQGQAKSHQNTIVATLTDDIFTGNVVEIKNTVYDINASKNYIGGGAMYLFNGAYVTIAVSSGKDLSYTGNKVIINGTVDPWYGGFAVLHRTAVPCVLSFDIDGNLTIGNETRDGADTIAGKGTVAKTGSGTLTINSDLQYFAGSLDIEEGTFVAAGVQIINAGLTVASGAAAQFNALTLAADSTSAGTLAADSIVVDGVTFKQTAGMMKANSLTVTNGGTATVLDRNVDVTMDYTGDIAGGANVDGSGSSATINGDVNVNLTSGTVTGNVYGTGTATNSGTLTVTGAVTVNQSGTNVKGAIDGTRTDGGTSTFNYTSGTFSSFMGFDVANVNGAMGSSTTNFGVRANGTLNSGETGAADALNIKSGGSLTADKIGVEAGGKLDLISGGSLTAAVLSVTTGGTVTTAGALTADTLTVDGTGASLTQTDGTVSFVTMSVTNGGFVSLLDRTVNITKDFTGNVDGGLNADGNGSSATVNGGVIINLTSDTVTGNVYAAGTVTNGGTSTVTGSVVVNQTGASVTGTIDGTRSDGGVSTFNYTSGSFGIFKGFRLVNINGAMGGSSASFGARADGVLASGESGAAETMNVAGGGSLTANTLNIESGGTFNVADGGTLTVKTVNVNGTGAAFAQTAGSSAIEDLYVSNGGAATLKDRVINVIADRSDVYAGGVIDGSGSSATVNGSVTVNLTSGTVAGDVYGAGKTSNGGTSTVTGAVTVNQMGANVSGAINGTRSDSGTSTFNYTGGSFGSFSGFTVVNINGAMGNSSENYGLRTGGVLSGDEKGAAETINVNSGAAMTANDVLVETGGTFNVAEGATVTARAVTVKGGVSNIYGELIQTGNETTAENGRIVVKEGGTMENDIVTASGSTINVNSGATVDVGTMTLADSTSLSLASGSQMAAVSLDVNGSSTVTVGSGATASVSQMSVSDSSSLNLASGSQMAAVSLDVNGSSAVTVGSGATASVSQMSVSDSSSLNLASGSQMAAVSLDVNSSGAVTVGKGATAQVEQLGLDAGTLTLQQGASASVTSLDVTGGSTVTLAGGSSADITSLNVGGSQVNVGMSNATQGVNLSVPRVVLNNATVVLDPVWQDGSELANKIAWKNADITDSTIIIGASSGLAFGTSDTSWLDKQVDIAGLTGSVSAALGIYAPQTIKGRTRLIVDGSNTTGSTSSYGSYAVYLADKSVLVINGSSLSGSAAISASGNSSASVYVDSGAKIYITGTTQGSTYKLGSGFTGGYTVGGTTVADGTYTKPSQLAFITLDSDLYEVLNAIISGGDVTVTVGIRSIADIDSNMNRYSDMVDSFVLGNSYGDSSYATTLIAGLFTNYSNGAAVAATLETTANFGSIAAGPAIGEIRHAQDAVQDHLIDTFDTEKRSSAWAVPYYFKDSASGMSAGAFDAGYDAKQYGVVFGIDRMFESGRVGIAFHVGKADIDGKDIFSSASGDGKYFGGMFYGDMKYGKWQFMGDVGFGVSKTDTELSTSVGNLNADGVDGKVFSMGAKALYTAVETGNLSIRPFVGARYIHYDQQDYDITYGGEKVYHVDDATMNLWNFSLGVKFDWAQFKTDSGWSVKPNAELAWTGAAGDRDISQKVRFNGRNTRYSSLPADVIDSNAVEVGLGMQAKKNNFTFGLKAKGIFSGNDKNYGINATFKWDF